MSSPVLTSHPDCVSDGENVTRLVSGGTGLIFKGSGFYLTDYGKNNSDKTKSKDKISDSEVSKKTKSVVNKKNKSIN
jgi:predicted nucleic acid-binding Zn ribbon protein